MRQTPFLRIWLLSLIFLTFGYGQPVTSALWGTNGELWDPGNSILRDFTNVGYKGGAEPIPDWPVAHSVTDFGAIPDDDIDDSQAFIDAIAACPDYHAVLVPEGKFTIAQKIEITNDYVCLRGEDMYGSVLFFPKYYGEVYIEETGFGPEQSPVYEKFIQLLGGSGKSFENLTFKFREQRNKGAWEYEGAGFIDYKSNVADSWIRNCVFLNFSSGMTVSATRTSFINLIFDQFNGRQGTDDAATKTIDGYGCILVRNCSYNLFHNIQVTGHYLQPIDLNESSSHNVYSQYRGNEQLNRSIGYHGGSSHYNLYTDMDLGVVRPANHESRSDETYWNVNDNYYYSEVWEEVYNSANRLLFVGYGDQWPAKTNDPDLWYEPADFGQMTPNNLYLAQLNYFNEPLPEAMPGPAPSRYEGDVFGVVPDDNIKVDDTWYYRFDLSDANLPAVVHARLRVHMDNNRISTPPYTFRAWSVTEDAWTEDTITSANKPALVSQLDDRWFAHADDDRVLEFDVTGFIQEQLVGGDGVVSLALDIPEAWKTPNLWSRQRGTKPELIIERVADPVPGRPSAPRNIGSTPLIGNILLDWEDHPESNVTYTVYRNPYKVEADGTYTEGYREYIDNGLVTSDVADIQSTMNWRPGRMYDGVVYKYRISAVDSHGYESARSKEIYAATLHPTNAPPVFAETITLTNATAGAEYSEDLSVHASDPESDPLWFHMVSGPEWLNVSADGVLSGEPLWSDAGVYPVTVQLTAIGGSMQKTVDIEVVLPADTPSGPPAAPAGLSAVTGENEVILDWNDSPEADWNAYTVYRSTTSGNGYTVLTDRQRTSDFIDTTTENDVTYYYVVTAVDSNGNESADSLEVAAFSVSDLTPPAVPSGLWKIPTADSILLQWDDNVESDLAGYSIYRSAVSGGTLTLLASGLTTASYSDTDVVDGATYYYVVTATDTSGNQSAQSSEIAGTYDADVKTVWLGEATDNIWDAAYWSAGLPDRSDNEGTVTRNALWDAATSTLSDYYLNLTGGTLTGTSFTIFFAFDGGEQAVTGGSIDIPGKTLQFKGGAVGTIDNANSSITASRIFLDTASLTLNDGTIAAGQLYFKGTGSFIMNGGTAQFTSGDALFGAQSFGGGSVQLNGGSLTAGNLVYASAWGLTLGGTTAGSAEFTSGFGGTNHNNSLIDIKWQPGSKMDLIVAGADWASIWNDGRMTYDGQNYTTLGSWSVVTAADGLGSGVRFKYDSGSGTLSLESAGPPQDTTPPAAPTGLDATPGDGSIQLNWNDNIESDLASYSLYRSTTSGSGYGLIASGLVSSDVIDSSVVNGITYYYIVTASDTNGNTSAPSNEVSATPGGSSGNTLLLGDIGMAVNWSEGVLPTDPELPGTITSANTGANRGTIPDTAARAGLAIRQTGGELTFTGFGTSVFDDVEYEMTGGTFTSTSFGHRILNNSVFEVSGGTVNVNAFGLETSSTLNVSSGSMTLSGNLTTKASVLNFTGGTVDVGGNAISSFNSGTLNFSGDVAFTVVGQMGIVHFGTSSILNIGAGDGSISVGTLEADSMTINWAAGSEFSLTATTLLDAGAASSWENLWNTGRMTYNGDDYTTLGNWSVVTSTGLGDGYSFAYDSGTATLSIMSGNQAPAFDSNPVTEVFATEDILYSATLSDNVSDPDVGDTLTFTKTGGDAWLNVAANGDLSGIPTNIDVGASSITVQVSDGNGGTATAAVNITVVNTNDAPVANADSSTVDEEGSVAVTLTGSDIDVGDTLSYAVVSGPANGSLSGTAPNLTYTPASDYNGSDSFTFKANDGTVDSDTATISITVNAVNDAPVANNDSVATDEDAAVAITLTGSDIDVGDTLTYSVVSGPANGSLSGTAPNLTYTPAADFNGSDSFTFTANDGNVDSNTATVNITVNAVNDAPAANTDSVTVDEDGSVAVTLTGSDIDVGDTLSYAVVNGPANGSLSGTAPNLTYTPAADFNGSDSFTFEANDGAMDSNTATISITVNAVNDAPVANNNSVTTDEDTAVAITLAGSDIDVGDTLTYAVVSGPANGSLSGTAPNLTYTPDPAFTGPDSFTFTANDGTVDSNTATVSITVNAVSTTNTLISGDIGVSANWSTGGLPTNPANPGIIDASNTGANRGTIPNTTARTGLAILQTGGELTFTGFGTSLFDAVEYEITGGTFSSTVFGHKILNNSVFDLSGGTVTANAFGVETSSTLNVAGGSMNLSGNLTTKGSVLNFSGGTVSVGGDAITSFNSGTLNFSGDVAFDVVGQMGIVHFGTSSTLNIGAGDGSISVGTLETDSMAINWVSGSGFSLTATILLDAGGTATWETLWNAGRMTYNGNDVATLGAWSVVSTAGFGDGQRFAYDVATDTLSLEPASTVTAPDIITETAGNITLDSAEVGFTVLDEGGEVPTVFLFSGLTDGGTTPANWDNSQSLGALTAGSYAVPLDTLSEGTTYYYSVQAFNSGGLEWGTTQSFTTDVDTSPKLVRSLVSGVTDTWQTFDLGQSYSSAVIIATPVLPTSSHPPVVTRIRNVSGSTFDLKVDRVDGLTGALTLDVSVIAVEEGVYTQATDGVTMEAVKMTSTVTDRKNAWNAEAATYQNTYTSPVVIGQVMSANDPLWSVFWCQGSGRTSAPNASNLRVGKHVGEDSITSRADETLGYIVIEAGSGTINGVAYTAGLGPDTVRGPQNSASGYTYNLTGLGSASAAAVSLAGMDGGDGGFASLFGATPLTATSLTLVADEDQFGDSERNHTTEEAGYLVFE